ncbi:hypothetical protein LTR95_000622 [Oleoguttula sp. CCFEE 5521]
MAVSEAPLTLEERHALYLIATEIPNSGYTVTLDSLAWGQLIQIYAHVFLVARQMPQGCRHRRFPREQHVIIMEEEHRCTRAGGSPAIAGNFTQEDIDVRARLRVDIRNLAIILTTDLGSAALSGNDGPPKLNVLQQRLEAADALISLSTSTDLPQLMSHSGDKNSPELITVLQPRLLVDLIKIARKGGNFETAFDLHNKSRAVSHAVIDLTGEDDEADACAGAARRTNRKRAHENAVKGWEAINIERFAIDHGSLASNLAAIAEINGNHKPTFTFLECFDSLLSPAGPRIMGYIKDAADASLRIPTELRGIWVGLERYGCEHRFRRPPLRLSEAFSYPNSPLYEAPMRMLHARDIDYLDGVARAHRDSGEVSPDDPARALGGVVKRVIIFEISGVAARMHGVMICQRELSKGCGGTGDVENDNVLQGRSFVHALHCRRQSRECRQCQKVS